MVYTAWLCCIVLSLLENLCGMFKLLCFSLHCSHCFLCPKKKNKRENYLLKVLCRVRHFLHLSVSQREPFSAPPSPATLASRQSGRFRFVPVFCFGGQTGVGKPSDAGLLRRLWGAVLAEVPELPLQRRPLRKGFQKLLSTVSPRTGHVTQPRPAVPVSF